MNLIFQETDTTKFEDIPDVERYKHATRDPSNDKERYFQHI